MIGRGKWLAEWRAFLKRDGMQTARRSMMSYAEWLRNCLKEIDACYDATVEELEKWEEMTPEQQRVMENMTAFASSCEAVDGNVKNMRKASGVNVTCTTSTDKP